MSMKNDFGNKMAKLLPKIMREFHLRVKSIITNEQWSLSQIVILEYLFEKKSSNMSEIATILQLTMGRATGIVDDMIAKKLIKRERDANDRRIVKVCLLKKGEEMAEKIKMERRESFNSMFSILTEEERETYLNIITKVCNSFGEKKKDEESWKRVL